MLKSNPLRLRAKTSGKLFGFSLLLCVLLGNPVGAAQQLLARQISAENLQEMPPAGIDAIGGVDDWLLSNGNLCAVVSAPAHQTYLSLYGGTLVDLWHCDKGNDQWVTLHEQRNLSKTGIAKPVQVTPTVGNGVAQLQVQAVLDGIETASYYRLRADRPNSLQVTLELRRTAPGAALNMLGLIMLHPRAALVPYTLNPVLREYSIGAQQPYIDTRDFGQVLDAVAPSGLRVLAGIPGITPAISYGIEMRSARLRDKGGEERSLRRFMIGSETFTNMAFFTEPSFYFSDKPGALGFLRSRFMDIEIGEVLIVELRITVGDRADVASVTDQIYAGRTVSGRVDAGPAGITVMDEDGRVLTFVRSDSAGEFVFRLPSDQEKVRLAVETEWSHSSHTIALDDSGELGTLATGAYAVLHLPDAGPMSIVFKGEDGTPDPVIHNTLTGLSLGGDRLYTGREFNRLNLSGVAGDIRSIRLAPGHYRVIGTRGMEYELSQTRIEVRAGSSTVLDLPSPQRAVDSAGLVAADFHLHSGISMDSNISPGQRLIDFVAQGGELMVSSEHNITSDLQPLVNRMGLSHDLVALPGVELTGMARSAAAPMTIGHANVFPVAADAHRFRGGTLPFEGKALGRVIGDYKSAFPVSIFQLNHPRTSAYDSDLSFFNHLSIGKAFDPARALSDPHNNSLLLRRQDSAYRDIDFDAMELLNGESIEDYLLIREDWFSLLRQGFAKIGTANSDSHRSAQLVAIPRTYLWLEDSDLRAISAADVASALKSGRVYGTSGPLLDVHLNGAVMGETVTGRKGTLQVSVQAASWVGVDELRVYVNGALTARRVIAAGQSLELPMRFEQDSFVTVEVSGATTPAYADVAPGFQSLAFSNPIFVDSDGDGYSRVSH